MANDEWLSPPSAARLVSVLWGGADVDPFGHPDQNVAARTVMGRHLDPDYDAYEFELRTVRGRTWWLQGPYSGKNPARTAAMHAELARLGRSVLNLTPAAAGSSYWKKHLWPNIDAVAWLGRLSFVAGCDVMNDDGTVRYEKGDLVKGNRTEIALLYTGPVAWRFRSACRLIFDAPTQEIRR